MSARLPAAVGRLAGRLHAALSWLLLTLSWLLLILPAGVILRLAGRSRIDRGRRRGAGSNRRRRERPIEPGDLRRPF